MAKSKPANPPANEPDDQQQEKNSPELEIAQTQTPVGASGDDEIVSGNQTANAEQQDGDSTEKSDDGAGDQNAEAVHDGGELHTGEAPFGYKADGTPRKSNAGRKTGAGATQENARQRERLRSVTPSSERPKVKILKADPALAVVNYQAMGNMVAGMFFHGGTMVFGKDWQPDTSVGEHVAVAGAFTDYFKATQMRDIPPGVALCFVLGTYSMKRVATKPDVQSRLKLFGAWIKSKMPRRKGASIYPIDSGATGLESH